ncbi:MAG: Putative lipoprotein [Catillopecten margaritatus gill symbiont]|uniref:Lipoprotein n=1 Tax=Catillopecten margaritatus gill symbiont TaxID=3083288 RepID=A0AAU6PHC0_9GAMM
MKKLLKLVFLMTTLSVFVVGCAEVKPYDYTALKKSKPRSILVIPPRNNSIEVEAPYIYLSTLTKPLTEKGYYVFPVAVIDKFLKENGLPTPAEMNGISLEKIDKHIGADTVLYVDIKEFGQKFLIFSSQSIVHATLKLVDVKTGELLWESIASAVYNPSGNNNNAGSPVATLLAQLISAAITQAVDSNMPITSRIANIRAINNKATGLLDGPYKVLPTK